MPGYWMHETSGVLKPAVMAYFAGTPMDAQALAAMRAYLRQWMDGPWTGARTAELAARIDGITSRAKLRRWLNDALDEGIDPL